MLSHYREHRIGDSLNIKTNNSIPYGSYVINETVIIINLWMSYNQDFKDWFCKGWYKP